jgi:hypothetical protein
MVAHVIVTFVTTGPGRPYSRSKWSRWLWAPSPVRAHPGPSLARADQGFDLCHRPAALLPPRVASLPVQFPRGGLFGLKGAPAAPAAAGRDKVGRTG